jgi:3-deoxy-D-manno-octulosonic-acid transferase
MLANVLYLFALAAVSPLVIYRRLRFGRYRRGLKPKLFGLSARSARACCPAFQSRPLWIHAVSVGEVNLIGGLLERLQVAASETPVVISVSTDSGYDLAVQRYGHERVFFCPLDFTWAVRRTLRHLNPRALVLAELELWPNLVRTATRAGIPVTVVNGRLSDRSCRGYQRFGWLTRPIFASLDRVLCQDANAAENFRLCGTPAERILVTGSLKFDDAPKSRDGVEVQQRMHWAGVDPWHRVWVVGSTQEGEEALALGVYRRLLETHSELRLVLVPRHPERFDRVAALVKEAGFHVHRRSSGRSLHRETWTADRVLLIDTIGELRHWWGVGQLATVGGSFGDRGGQNMLEPAGYGNAISFGPNTRNFADIASRLLQAGGAVRVQNADGLRAFVKRCVDDPPAADALGHAAQAVVEAHRGATDRSVQAILETVTGLEPEQGSDSPGIPARDAA